MKKLRLLVALTTEDNDFQREQASEAQRLAKKLDLDVQVLYADGDAIVQSQQILNVVQGPEAGRPDGIVLHPVSGTSLPHVARAAVQAGIGWGVMGRQPEYLGEFRAKGTAPVFCVTSDHTGIGRIQAQQAAALIPKGGNILYVQGPADSGAAQRTSGMQQRKQRTRTSSCSAESGPRKVVIRPFRRGRIFPLRRKSVSRCSARKMTRWPWARAKPFNNCPIRLFATGGSQRHSRASMGS